VCRELSSQVALWATGVVVSKDRANEESIARAASRTGATAKQPRGSVSAGSGSLEANSEGNVLRPDWVPDGYRLDLQEPYLTATYGREQDAKMYREALRKALMLVSRISLRFLQSCDRLMFCGFWLCYLPWGCRMMSSKIGHLSFHLKATRILNNVPII
jgi:hypothetical protein